MEPKADESVAEEKPNLTVIEGGLSQAKVSESDVKPTTGIPEGQAGPILEKSDFLTTIRRALSRLLEKADTNKENVPPPGKAF